jgi:mRNA-degrading endonuclease RelE of RelBE toxin-antitoxin system
MSYLWELSDMAKAAIGTQVAWYESDEAHGGFELSERWVSALEPALVKLASEPRRYGMAPENGRWNPGVEIRQMLFRPWRSGIGWRVLYTIDEGKRLVTILQICHEHRRWLFEAGDEADQST